jgi:hypothetical protein
MTIKANVGLVKIAGSVGTAANEDRVVEDGFAEINRRIDATAGWDPYDVWRTRVKQARDLRTEPKPDKRRP